MKKTKFKPITDPMLRTRNNENKSMSTFLVRVILSAITCMAILGFGGEKFGWLALPVAFILGIFVLISSIKDQDKPDFLTDLFAVK